MDGHHGEQSGVAVGHPEPGGDSTTIKVNGTAFALHTAKPKGRDVLAAAGQEPVDEHILIQVVRPGSRSVGLDERVGLGPQRNEFYAFRADRVLNFTVDERGYEWGEATIAEARIRDLSGIGEDMVLILKRKGQPDLELDEGSALDLGGSGVEHLRTAKGMVTVSYNGADVQIPRGTYTTEQLKAIFGVEPGYELDIMEGQHLRTLKPGEKIKVRKGLKFISQVPCGGSS